MEALDVDSIMKRLNDVYAKQDWQEVYNRANLLATVVGRKYLCQA